jgi:NADH-quinone oxidoreductase subunit M
MLPMVQRVFFNELETTENREVFDLSGREIAILAPLCALMIWIGWNPTPFLERMEPSVRAVIERVEGVAEVEAPADVFIEAGAVDEASDDNLTDEAA